MVLSRAQILEAAGIDLDRLLPGHIRPIRETGTTIFFGVMGLIASYFLVGWLVRKRITSVQKELEERIDAMKRAGIDSGEGHRERR